MLRALLASWWIASAAVAADAPEISRSGGVEGGVVVLWPRIAPRSTSATPRNAAWVVQQELNRMIAEAFPGRPVDLRPEPERVCPQAGCAAVAVGAVVVHSQSGCAVVATVSGPGRSSATLVPWAGSVDLKSGTVPFRQPPESFLTIRDFQRCDALGDPLKAGAASVLAAIAAALGVPVPVAAPPPPVPVAPLPPASPSPTGEDVGWP